MQCCRLRRQNDRFVLHALHASHLLTPFKLLLPVRGWPSSQINLCAMILWFHDLWTPQSAIPPTCFPLQPFRWARALIYMCSVLAAAFFCSHTSSPAVWHMTKSQKLLFLLWKHLAAPAQPRSRVCSSTGPGTPSPLLLHETIPEQIH